MEAIISAEDFFLSKFNPNKTGGYYEIETDFAIEIAIEFAKLHREAILKEIAEDYTYYLKGDEGSEILNKEKFFKEVYPINNIK
jgi:ABC-type molybdate transport system substrate-binding protein